MWLFVFSLLNIVMKPMRPSSFCVLYFSQAITTTTSASLPNILVRLRYNNTHRHISLTGKPIFELLPVHLSHSVWLVFRILSFFQLVCKNRQIAIVPSKQDFQMVFWELPFWTPIFSFLETSKVQIILNLNLLEPTDFNTDNSRIFSFTTHTFQLVV